ncbi:MAG: hypothetical protein K0V04_03100 [Deltaproteobacteria bacterium]|nr:hypothetical protein [Deltaproteobacteria bacterium]
MPLTRYMNEQIATVRGFLDDPEAVLLEVRCVDEQLPALTKMLVNLGEHEDSEDLMVGVDGDLDAPQGLCDALEVALTQTAAEAESMFEAKRTPLHVPQLQQAPPHPDPVREHRLAEYAERLVQQMVPFVRALVLVIKARPNGDGAALRIELARVCRALASGRVKLVALADPSTPLLDGVDVDRPRIRVLDTKARPDDMVCEGLTDPLTRLLTHDGPAGPWLPRQAGTLAVARRRWVVTLSDVRFGSPMHLFGRAVELALQQLHAIALRRGLADASEPWLEQTHDPLAETDAERFFATTLLHYIDEVVPAEDHVVVLLAPTVPDSPADERSRLTESLHRLARELTSARLRVVAVAPGAPGPRPAPQALRTHEFRIDDRVVEQGLRDKLEEPDLSPIVRLRCTASLGGFAMTRGNPEEGMDLAVRSLELAQDMDDPVEEGVAWYGLGNALYRSGSLAQSADAYARAVDLALCHDHAVLAAQGLTGIGHCHYVIGQPEPALEHYSIARTYYERLGNLLMEAYVLSWMAESHIKAERRVPAEQCFREALVCCERAEPLLGQAARASEADIRQRMARFYQGQGMRSAGNEQQRRAETLGPIAPLTAEP